MKKISPEEFEGLEVVIPELEEELKKCGGHPFGRGRSWGSKEEGILFRYYGRVPIDKLILFLPGRTKCAISSKVRSMGLTNRES